MMRLALCTAALIGMTSIAHAQTMGQAMGTSAGSVPYDQAEYGSGSMSGGCGHTVAITDEYGFRYDSMGDRLNARGCVIAPPITPPGAGAV
jgi:hypothetical protein